MGMTSEEKRRLKGGNARSLDLAGLPPRVTRQQAAEILNDFYFKISPRSLERWPIAWRLINGRAHGDLADIIAHADSMVDSAPIIMGGQSSKANHQPSSSTAPARYQDGRSDRRGE